MPVVQDPEFTNGGEHLIEDHHVKGTLVVSAGRLTLRRCTVETLDISVSSPDEIVLEAEDCLFDTLLAGAGAVRLESCTVMDKLTVLKIDAANCLFNNGSISTPLTGAIRYSRIPTSSITGVTLTQCTTEAPLFFSDSLGAPVRGVLRPDTPQPILFGAEDGGELGAYHRGRQGRPVRIPLADDEVLSFGADSAYLLSDLLFEGAGTVRIERGALNLQRVAAANLVVESVSASDEQGDLAPVLSAQDCLFDQVEAAQGLARLEYCTVLMQLIAARLQASDCLFVSELTLDTGTQTHPHCIRFSRIPTRSTRSARRISVVLPQHEPCAGFPKIRIRRGGRRHSQAAGIWGTGLRRAAPGHLRADPLRGRRRGRDGRPPRLALQPAAGGGAGQGERFSAGRDRGRHCAGPAAAPAAQRGLLNRRK